MRRPRHQIDRFAIAVMAVAMAAACGDAPRRQDPAIWTPAGPDSELHPVTIAAPASTGQLNTPLQELSGSPVGIGCATCHVEGTVEALAARVPDPDEEFHAEIEVEHAELECGSCHVDGEPHRMRVASGATFPIRDSMRLCSQCHGPIRQAFDHGAHGGMRGYWDLQRGPRVRNACITCHDPHQPDYPDVSPVEGPRDRFTHESTPPGSLVERRYPQEEHE